MMCRKKVDSVGNAYLIGILRHEASVYVSKPSLLFQWYAYAKNSPSNNLSLNVFGK